MSLVNTRLLNFREQTNADKNEIRGSVYGASETFRAQTSDPSGIITPQLTQMSMRSEGSTIEIPVLDDHAPSITNVTQPVTIVDDPVTSQLMAITFVDYYFGFLIHPAKHFNNEISMQKEFNNKLSGALYAYKAAQETAALNALEAAKTQVLSDDLGGRYALTTNVAVGALAEQDAMVGDINMLMLGNDYFGMNDIIANPSLGSHIRNRLGEQGTYNDRDKSYQFTDKTIRFSNALANGVGHKATGFAVQKGSLGVLERFSADCQLQHVASNGKTWSIENMPLIGEQFGTFSYEDAVDYSATDAATARLTATKVEAYGFHKSVAYMVSYNSSIATKSNPVMKFAIATT
jgi:hypothetical protein